MATRSIKLFDLNTALPAAMQVAEEFKDEPSMWFPHNMDFRGRAYPMPPHLNHLGPDTSRGILQFAEGRVLGEHGLGWLYVQASHAFIGTPGQSTTFVL